MGIRVGVTLSSAQAAACRRYGLDVHIYDARRVTRDSFGPFDAVASLGAFEHFCSPEDYTAGRQEELYRGFFQRVAGTLPESGRFYLQTMVFGHNTVPFRQISTRAPRSSDARMLSLMGCQFPGSWLPSGEEQITRCAEPHFRLVSSGSCWITTGSCSSERCNTGAVPCTGVAPARRVHSQSRGTTGGTRPGKLGTTRRAYGPRGRRSIDAFRSSKQSNSRMLVAIW